MKTRNSESGQVKNQKNKNPSGDTKGESKANGFKWWLKNKTKKSKDKLKTKSKLQLNKTTEITENADNEDKNNVVITKPSDFENIQQLDLIHKHASIHLAMLDYLEINNKINLSKKKHELIKIAKIKDENSEYIEVELFKNIHIKFPENLTQILREKIKEIKTEESELVVYYDGGCNVKSNGLGVCGVTVALTSNESTTQLLEISANLGPNSTNNTAEYMGLVLSLVVIKVLFHQIKFKRFTLNSDSELVVRQMTGVYQVKKPHIAILYNIAQNLYAKIKVDINDIQISHIRRSLNKQADKLANYAKNLTDNTLTVFY